MFWDVSSWHSYKGLWGFLLLNLWRKDESIYTAISTADRHLQKPSRGETRQSTDKEHLLVGSAAK